MTIAPTQGILVATNNSLSNSGGGVQLCTQDHLAALEKAGFTLEVVSFNPTHDLLTRFLNRLDGRGYRRMIPAGLAEKVISAVKQTGATFVFFNEADFTFLAWRIRREFGDSVKLVHLSHGVRSTDIGILQQITREKTGETKFSASDAKTLGARLQFESDYRRRLDASVCIAPLDAETERWLGVPQVRWFARPIREKRIASRPINGRVGCMSTLNHIPNYNGLTKAFNSLTAQTNAELCVRLVGGPQAIGEELAARFSFVQYLGPLDDRQLRSEAESWCCFLHPIFDYARGCNMKVAIALGWGLPLVTTVFGVRGYFWDEEILPLASTIPQLSSMLNERSKLNSFGVLSGETDRIAALQPPLENIAAHVREFLLCL